jgi:tRNA G18 (ribose-2'-O)-methylase SpoU
MMRKLSMEELNRKSDEEFKSTEKQPIIILLDNVRSLHNVGSVFRTSDAFLVEKIILTGITGTPPNRELNKTALGSTESVTWEYFEKPEEAVSELKKEKWKIVSLEQTDHSLLLQQFSPGKEKICYVFGNEVFGISDPVIQLSDLTVEIPQFGTKHSFNISVTAGMVLWNHFLKSLA